MGVVRVLGIALAGVIGLAIGVALYLVLGLLVATPSAIGAAAPKQDWDVAIDITDAFLTAQLNKEQTGAQASASASGGSGRPGGGGGGGGGGVKLSDAKAAMHADGTVNITGNYAVVGRNVAVEIAMKPSVGQDGKLAVEVTKAQFGPIAVPSGLSSLIENPINEQIAKALDQQSFTLTKVTLRDGGMVVQARAGGK